jgi:hypothetical protein
LTRIFPPWAGRVIPNPDSSGRGISLYLCANVRENRREISQGHGPFEMTGLAPLLPALTKFPCNPSSRGVRSRPVFRDTALPFEQFTEENPCTTSPCRSSSLRISELRSRRFLFWPRGTALWLETDNVQVDAQGHYTALLGSASPQGLPVNLFTTGQAHWLAVQPLLQGFGEQPRVLLVGAPYASKVGDAETIGGLPPSAHIKWAQARPDGYLHQRRKSPGSRHLYHGRLQAISPSPPLARRPYRRDRARSS